MPKAAVTRINGAFQVQTDPTNPISGFFLPQLTTAQATALTTASPLVIQNGFMYYNTDINGIYTYINGALLQLYTDPVAGFVFPNGTTATYEGGAYNVDGVTYFNTITSLLRTRTNGVWTTIETSTSAAVGTGLAAGNSPITLPSGVAGSVEPAGNLVDGFIYYNTNNTLPRIRVNGAWCTIPATPTSSTINATGLGAGSSPYIFPSGVDATVEASTFNHVVGYTYYGLTSNTLRIWTGAAWRGITPV